MTSEPALYRIEADIRDDTIVALHISQPNAVDVTRLVIGKPASEAPDTLARMLAVCAEAQHAASLGAIEAATGVAADDKTRRGRARSVLQERLLNGLWRLAIDWPRALGLAEMPEVVVAVRRQPGALRASVDRAIAHIPLAALQAAAENHPLLLDRIAAAIKDPLAALDALEGLERSLDPVWCGDFGGAQTSRGLLRHSADVVDGIVTRYSIVAPTDLAMAPGGDVERVLVGLRGPDLAPKAALRLALIDPCAPVELFFSEPADA